MKEKNIKIHLTKEKEPESHLVSKTKKRRERRKRKKQKEQRTEKVSDTLSIKTCHSNNTTHLSLSLNTQTTDRTTSERNQKERKKSTKTQKKNEKINVWRKEACGSRISRNA
jgi:hypothetical protein